MKRFFIAIAVIATLCSCGTSRQNTVRNSDDEVIDLGYSKEVRRNSTSSAKSIKTSTIDMSGYSNIYEYLQGRVSGLQIDGDASSGNCTITIRGVKSLYSSSEPLFLLDGQEINDLSGINPNDVDSVSVLKDPSDCAIYGSRGANGVILIRTKKPGN